MLQLALCTIGFPQSGATLQGKTHEKEGGESQEET